MWGTHTSREDVVIGAIGNAYIVSLELCAGGPILNSEGSEIVKRKFSC